MLYVYIYIYIYIYVLIRHSSTGRISIVDYNGHVLLDSYIECFRKIHECHHPIVDKYRWKQYSELYSVLEEVRDIIKVSILVTCLTEISG